MALLIPQGFFRTKGLWACFLGAGRSLGCFLGIDRPPLRDFFCGECVFVEDGSVFLHSGRPRAKPDAFQEQLCLFTLPISAYHPQLVVGLEVHKAVYRTSEDKRSCNTRAACDDLVFAWIRAQQNLSRGWDVALSLQRTCPRNSLEQEGYTSIYRKC